MNKHGTAHRSYDRWAVLILSFVNVVDGKTAVFLADDSQFMRRFDLMGAELIGADHHIKQILL